MNARPVGLFALCLACLACLMAGGCAAPAVIESGFNPALLPPPPPSLASKARGPIMLRLDAVAGAAVQTILRPRTLGNTNITLAIGQIVAGAARAALAEQFETVDSDNAAIVLQLRAIRFDVDDHLVYIIPLGPLTTGRIDLDSRLWVEAQLQDGQGHVLWTRSYDSGRETSASGRRGVGPFEGHVPPQQLTQMAHEQAFRLMQSAARDVRRWVEDERLRERVL